MPKLTASALLVNASLVGIVALGGCATTSQPADEYIDHAQQAREREQIDRARTYAEMAVEEGHRVSEAEKILASVARHRAETHFDDGEYHRAIDAFLEAADYEPARLVRARDLRRAFDAAQQADLDDQRLLELGQLVLQENPEDPQLRRDLAHRAEDIGDYAVAVEQYFWLFTADPTDRQIGLRLGISHLAVDDPEAAVSVLRRVRDAHPDDVQVALNLADAYAETDDEYRAETIYRQLLEQFPDHPVVLRRYAEFEHQRGRTDRARQLMDRAAEQSPGIEEREMRPLQ